MTAMPIAKLNRKILHLSGDGVTDWLSGLITNRLDQDIVFAALLTPQGKIIADFFASKLANGWQIDVAEKYIEVLTKRLKLYKLRAPITIEPVEIDVFAAWAGTGEEGFADPRHAALGRRLYDQDLTCEAGETDYDQYRLSLGIPDSQWDFDSGDVFPAGANMDRLNGVDFKKGCFVGQEVVSRMYRKTEIKKRLRGFRFDGALTGTKITAGERMIGEVLHTNNGLGMAMIRHDRLPDDEASLMVEDKEISLLDLPDGNSPQ